jgi:hypothetical protein
VVAAGRTSVYCVVVDDCRYEICHDAAVYDSSAKEADILLYNL